MHERRNVSGIVVKEKCQGTPWSVATYNFYFRFRVLDVDRIWPIEGIREVRMMFFP